jgi:hypothetical protein
MQPRFRDLNIVIADNSPPPLRPTIAFALTRRRRCSRGPGWTRGIGDTKGRWSDFGLWLRVLSDRVQPGVRQLMAH